MLALLLMMKLLLLLNLFQKTHQYHDDEDYGDGGDDDDDPIRSGADRRCRCAGGRFYAGGAHNPLRSLRVVQLHGLLSIDRFGFNGWARVIGQGLSDCPPRWP